MDTQTFEVKYRKVGHPTQWENITPKTMVVLDESEVILYWAYIVWENQDIDEVRYNIQGSLQGNYITRQMANRIAKEQHNLFSSMDPARVEMLCLTLLDAVETTALSVWAVVGRNNYLEDVNGNVIDAWAWIKVWTQDENDGRKFLLTPFTIEKGIRVIVDTPNFAINKSLYADIAWADKHVDEADLDAEMADCIIQAALFGSILYG